MAIPPPHHPKIEEIRIQNYKMFQDVHLKSLPRMCVFLGANGSGKSTLFDVFTFLKDALTHNVRQAFARRGGFREVVSRNQSGPILIEIKFRDREQGPLITYRLELNSSPTGHPFVQKEILQYRRGQTGQPWRFLNFQNGAGFAITNEEDYDKPDAQQKHEEQRLESPEILAIKGLGQFERFRAAASFRHLIENWNISDFHISDARESQESGYAEHLTTRGENLPLVAQYLYENHPDAFQNILNKMEQRIPGVSEVKAELTVDGRVVLKFRDGTFQDPFIARHVSDGTIKMFAYLLLLNDPKPHPLLAVEEPENQLYPELLPLLAEEFRDYARRGGQVFLSTHSYELVNYVQLDELFWLTKNEGYTQIHRASDDEQLQAFVSLGDPPGALWRQKLFKGASLR